MYCRHTILELVNEGANFRKYMYVPEVDKVTGTIIHERSDHNHLVKRVATSTRAGRYQALDLDAFDAAMLDKDTGKYVNPISYFMSLS